MTPRAYRPMDFTSCLEVFDSNVPRFFSEEERDEFAGFLRNLPGPYLVLVDPAGDVIGCGGYALREGTGTADLCWGMIRQQLHGQGHGRLLTETRMDRILNDVRVREVALNTSQHTVGFYEGLGFRTIEVIKDGYGPGMDRCEMRFQVPAPEA